MRAIVPPEWNLHYESWIIADGEPHRRVSESFDWFAIEFWTEERLAKWGNGPNRRYPLSQRKRGKKPWPTHSSASRGAGGFCSYLFCCSSRLPGAHAQNQTPEFRVVVLAEAHGIHRPFVDAAIPCLRSESVRNNFAVDYIETTTPINDAFLAKYKVFIQLDYPPYGWTPAAVDAFKKYIEEGRGGWIGFHHATLLGEFDGYPMWPWFSQFMGGIRFTNYIPKFATAKVVVEDSEHPALKGVPASFVIENEEWYTYDKSPRPNVHVLATVDESTYSPRHNNENERRPSGHLVQRAGQSAKHLHLHGAPSGTVPESGIHEDLQ